MRLRLEDVSQTHSALFYFCITVGTNALMVNESRDILLYIPPEVTLNVQLLLHLSFTSLALPCLVA